MYPVLANPLREQTTPPCARQIAAARILRIDSIGGARMRLLVRCTALALLSLGVSAAGAPPPDGAQEALRQLAEWRQSQPQSSVQYDYQMTARVRLILFWVGKDDVGGGFIRLRSSQGEQEFKSIEVLFGSDPARTPRKINRWGAAYEVLRRRSGPVGKEGAQESSLFFGLMKASKGTSATEMQRELASEAKNGAHAFTAGLGLIQPQQAVSFKVPFFTPVDLDIHGGVRAEELAVKQLETPGIAPQAANPNQSAICPRVKGFLFSIQELLEADLAGATPLPSLCFLNDAQILHLTLDSSKRVVQKSVRSAPLGDAKPGEIVYRDLIEAHFNVHNETTGKRSSFTLLVPTSGPLRGIPVEFSYRPNWWFEVTLHLRPAAAPPQNTGPAPVPRPL